MQYATQPLVISTNAVMPTHFCRSPHRVHLSRRAAATRPGIRASINTHNSSHSPLTSLLHSFPPLDLEYRVAESFDVRRTWGGEKSWFRSSSSSSSFVGAHLAGFQPANQPINQINSLAKLRSKQATSQKRISISRARSPPSTWTGTALDYAGPPYRRCIVRMSCGLFSLRMG